ncbi:two-component system QseEF-associated lipoprotein QseG [Enterobacteriaceae bacterium RIT691]|nr:two-component system QseEF-associated lipoprotein QseG [Enterobacteriaceae bacterium RIT691]
MKHSLVTLFPDGFRLFAGAVCLLLAGCSSSNPTTATSGEENLPQQQVADFLSTDCVDVWSLHGEVTEKNPLYWLRAMDCGGRLSPQMARTEAKLHTDETWQDAFRRGILLGSAKITPLERRDMLASLDGLSPQIPPQVRSLFRVWRDGQASQLQLSDERSRYSKLQQSTDGELDTLRQQQQHLRSQLDLTTRKLENLTDIERQLSSRKPSGSSLGPDSAHPGELTPATGEEKP